MIELTWGIYEINSWSTNDLSLMANNVIYEVYFESDISSIRYFKGIKYSVATDRLYFVGVDGISYEVRVPSLTVTIYRTTMVDDALRDFFLQGSVITLLPKRKIETPQIYYNDGVITLKPVMFADRYELFLNGKKVSEGRLNSLTNLKGDIIPKNAGFIYQKFFNVAPNSSYYFGFSTYRNYEKSAQDSLNVRYGYSSSYMDLGAFDLNDSLQYKYINGNTDFLDVWWKYQNDSSYNKFVGDYIDKVYVFPTRITIDTDGIPTGQVSVKIYSDDERFEESDFSNVIDYKSSFFLKLYNFNCESNVVDKTEYLTELSTRRGVFREETSILSPSIEIEGEEIPVGNYAYFGHFNRYYFVTNITSVRKNLWRVDMSVDVLMTNRLDIAKQKCLIGRNEFEWNDFLVDDNVTSYSSYKITIYESRNNFITSITSNGEDITYQWFFDYSHCVISCINSFTNAPISYPIDNYGQPNILKSNTIIYFEDSSDYAKFETGVLNPTFWDTIGDLFQNHADYWTSSFICPLNYYGFSLRVGTDIFNISNRSIIYMGTQEVGTNNEEWQIGRYIRNRSRIKMWCRISSVSDGNILNFPKFNSFLDIEPISKYQLYIPFVGLVDINSSYLRVGYDTVVADVDITNGDTMFTLARSEDIDGDFFFNESVKYPYCWESNIYVEIPMGRTNKAELMQKAVVGAINVVADVAGLFATGGTYNAISSATAASKQDTLIKDVVMARAGRDVVNSGTRTASNLLKTVASMTPTGSVKGGNSGILKIRQEFRPVLYKTQSDYFYPIDYNHLYGRPLLETRVLGTLKGFTVVDSCHLVGFNCTADEMADIEKLLLNGVIL